MVTSEDIGNPVGFWIRQTGADGKEIVVKVLHSAPIGQAIETISQRGEENETYRVAAAETSVD